MPHYYPIRINSGRSVAGESLGFHAYSLRVDNLTNQWLLEETSMAWIPPYSLGMCLRLYGTGVALIINEAPVGQPQLQPIVGEQTIGVYSDQLRTEVGGQAVRQFTLVQSVSDLTQGPQPALPGVGITRLYAAADGELHYVLSTGTDRLVIDTGNLAANVATQPLGGDLYGTISAGHINVAPGSTLTVSAGGATSAPQWTVNTGLTWLQADQVELHSGRSAILDDGSGQVDIACTRLAVMNAALNTYTPVYASEIISPGNSGIVLNSGTIPLDYNTNQPLMKRTDAAGGDLTGAYPNPTVYPAMGTWSPLPYQGNTIPNTSSGVYWKLGRLIIAVFNCSLTGAGVAGWAVGLQGLPVAGSGIVGSNIAAGNVIYLNSGIAYYTANPAFQTTTTIQFMAHNQSNWLGLTPSFTAKSADNLAGYLIYEAAS